MDLRLFHLMAGMKPKVTVYVRSKKVLAGETLVEELYPVKRATSAYEISRDTWFKVKLKKIYNYALPDDQKTVVKDAERLGKRMGFEIRVVDITKENVFYRLWMIIKGIRNFPAVETSLGSRLQAPFSQREFETFISEPALPDR